MAVENTGFLNPLSAASVNPGDTAWTNPNNARTQNASGATCKLAANKTSKVLYMTNYGFAIDADATIVGIEIKVRRKADKETDDSSVKLVQGGGGVGDELATYLNWGTNYTNATYGGATDLCGWVATPDLINDTNFGVGFQTTTQTKNSEGNIDVIQINIHYEPASSGGLLLNMGAF